MRITLKLVSSCIWAWRLVSWEFIDRAALAVQFVFLAGTQRGLLELLFGAGIMIMARRAMTPDGPVAIADLHYRRNLLLILFGLFNALVLFAESVGQGLNHAVSNFAIRFDHRFKHAGTKHQKLRIIWLRHFYEYRDVGTILLVFCHAGFAANSFLR